MILTFTSIFTLFGVKIPRCKKWVREFSPHFLHNADDDILHSSICPENDIPYILQQIQYK
jgi:hypothetical protein